MMPERIVYAVTLLATLGCGLMAGVFFAFSAFVMKALAKLPPLQAIAAMQSINVVVINPWFMSVFLGTAAGCAIVAIQAAIRWQEPGAAYRVAGAVFYVIGTFGVTIAGNVPLNNALAGVNPNSDDAARRWAEFLSPWMMWNHVRTIAALVAMLLLILALCSPRGQAP